MFESASAVPAPRVFSECLSRAICKFFPNCLCVLVRSELLFVCVHHELSFGVKKPSLVSSVAHVFQLSWLHMCACVLLHALYPPSVVISALCETGTLPVALSHSLFTLPHKAVDSSDSTRSDCSANSSFKYLLKLKLFFSFQHFTHSPLMEMQ